MNSTFDQHESGVQGVHVSNGRDCVTTDENGAYEIELREDMHLTIVQPFGWRVPTDDRMIPQFFYIHKENGTGYEMRLGGLPSLGPAPEQINFPIIRHTTADTDFSCAVLGDPQTYSNEQIGWLKDGVLADIIDSELGQSD